MPDLVTITGSWPATVDRCLVTGSRRWPTTDRLLPDVLGQIYDLHPMAVLVVGYDPVRRLPAGVDRMAYTLWRKLGGTVETHPADWQRFGRGAGHIRNGLMIAAGADLALAFILDESPGASHCAEAADKAGIPLVVFREPRRA